LIRFENNPYLFQRSLGSIGTYLTYTRRGHVNGQATDYQDYNFRQHFTRRIHNTILVTVGIWTPLFIPPFKPNFRLSGPQLLTDYY